MELFESGGPAVAFKVPGDRFRGVVVSAKERQATEPSGKVRTFDDGTPQLVTLLNCEPVNPGEWGEDDVRTLYVQSTMRAPFAAAARAQHVNEANLPGTLVDVTYTGDGVTQTRGHNPPKQWAITLQPGFRDVGYVNGSLPPEEPF